MSDLVRITILALLLASCAEDKGVYICTGGQSKRYHKERDCRGLNQCSRTIKKITIEEAKAMHRTPCRYCHK